MINQKQSLKFEEIYYAYYQALLKVIGKLIPNDELAEDVLQEAYIKIWRGLPYYDAEKGGIYNWMASICTNVARDLLRSRYFKNHKRTDSLELMKIAVDREQCFTPFADADDVLQLAGMLSKPCALIIRLSYADGYTQTEIGTMLNLPLGTVKSRKRRAIAQLKKNYR
jgi:RNA polymerase sigma factor (sigma-70 family)